MKRLKHVKKSCYNEAYRDSTPQPGWRLGHVWACARLGYSEEEKPPPYGIARSTGIRGGTRMTAKAKKTYALRYEANKAIQRLHARLRTYIHPGVRIGAVAAISRVHAACMRCRRRHGGGALSPRLEHYPP